MLLAGGTLMGLVILWHFDLNLGRLFVEASNTRRGGQFSRRVDCSPNPFRQYRSDLRLYSALPGFRIYS